MITPTFIFHHNSTLYPSSFSKYLDSLNIKKKDLQNMDENVHDLIINSEPIKSDYNKNVPIYVTVYDNYIVYNVFYGKIFRKVVYKVDINLDNYENATNKDIVSIYYRIDADNGKWVDYSKVNKDKDGNPIVYVPLNTASHCMIPNVTYKLCGKTSSYGSVWKPNNIQTLDIPDNPILDYHTVPYMISKDIDYYDNCDLEITIYLLLILIVLSIIAYKNNYISYTNL